MANESSNSTKAFDPMEPWREMRNTYLDAWAKSMVEVVNSEAYAQATGSMLDTYLTVSRPFREVLETAMIRTLEQLAMPTRGDVISIAERMTNMEMRLDDLDAKLDQILRAAQSGAQPVSAAAAVVTAKRPRLSKEKGRKTQLKKGKK
jgi:polyhydroxyalkanoic acid synthase PhaR subunit